MFPDVTEQNISDTMSNVETESQAQVTATAQQLFSKHVATLRGINDDIQKIAATEPVDANSDKANVQMAISFISEFNNSLGAGQSSTSGTAKTKSRAGKGSEIMTTPGNKEPENQGAQPSAPITIADAEVAASYVERELHRAAQSRTVTAIVGMPPDTGRLNRNRRSSAAKRLRTYSPAPPPIPPADLSPSASTSARDDLQTAIAQRLPTFIAQIPDQAIQQMPAMRTKLEDTLTTNLNQYADSTSKSLNTQLMTYLELAQGRSPHCPHQRQGLRGRSRAGPRACRRQFVTSLQTQSDGGETLQQKIDMTQTSMDEVKAKLDHLASNKNLSADDKRTRHIVALMARSINTAPKLNVPQAISTAQTTVSTSL